MAPRVLIVDDDPTVTEVVSAYLGQAGIEVLAADNGPAAVAAALEQDPDLLVLDLMIPGFDGIEVCRRIREARPSIPIVMVTARGEEADRIAGLEAGADDYVVKPFSPRELVLRVQSVLRRASPGVLDAPSATAVLRDRDLVLDPSARTVRRGGHPLALASREFELLEFLLSHPGVAFSREELLAEVWGWSFGDASTVTVHVRWLREKVEADPARPTRLATVWGRGYRWDPAT
jgi:DNA-binding response OmpR family regulator